MSELSDREKQIDTSISALENKFTSIDQGFAAQHAATDQILKRLESIDSRLKSLESANRKF